jgi:hypothetical protein
VEYTDFNFSNQLHKSGNYEANVSKIWKKKYTSTIRQPVKISCLMFWIPVSNYRLTAANIRRVIYEHDTKME